MLPIHRCIMINKLNYSSGGCAGFSPVSLLILKINLRTLFVYNLRVIINISKKKASPQRDTNGDLLSILLSYLFSALSEIFLKIGGQANITTKSKITIIRAAGENPSLGFALSEGSPSEEDISACFVLSACSAASSILVTSNQITAS